MKKNQNNDTIELDKPKNYIDILSKLEYKDYSKPKIINLSNRHLNINFDTRCMKELYFLPDYSESNGKLPVGTVAVYEKSSHKINPEYIGSDIGCGMLLAKFTKKLEKLYKLANDISTDLHFKETDLGSLGGGNHFVTIYKIKNSKSEKFKSDENLVLIHGGSRTYGIDMYEEGFSGKDYFIEQKKIIDYAKNNRLHILEIVKKFGKIDMEIILDKYHNFVEENDSNEIIYRKGAVKVMPDELSILPSSMSDEALLVKAGQKVSEIKYSLPHATGRKLSRSEARRRLIFLNGMPDNIFIPAFMTAEYLATELPQCYRKIDEVYPMIKDYIEIEARLEPETSIMV